MTSSSALESILVLGGDQEERIEEYQSIDLYVKGGMMLRKALIRKSFKLLTAAFI